MGVHHEANLGGFGHAHPLRMVKRGEKPALVGVFLDFFPTLIFRTTLTFHPHPDLSPQPQPSPLKGEGA